MARLIIFYVLLTLGSDSPLINNIMKIKTSRYIPLTQQPFCCTPTCIQMILLRRNLIIFSQEEIGYDFGLTVPKKYKKLLPNAKTGKKPSGGWGTQVNKKEYSINNFFRRHKIQLKEDYFSVSRVKNIKEWIKEQIKKNNDIIVCFDYGKLYGGKGQGHVSILNSILDKCVTLIDPKYDVPKYRKVALERLIKSMEFHGEKNNGGFWLISPK